ncbi:MAG: RnfABCDGE type electron transport complex subunit D [Crocinitomicaceae bacterium]
MQAISFHLFKTIRRDARHFQIIYLSTFLLYGIQFLDWDFNYTKILTIIASTLSTQWVCIKLTNGHVTSLKSGLITALGLCLLLNSSSLLTLAIAGVVAIAAKYTLRHNRKHLFNPANFGIVFSIIIFEDAWISPGQWGSNALFLFVLAVLGGIVLHKVGRLETSIVFLISLFILEYSRTVLYQGWELDVLLHKFSSGTLLLFTFFMITDPMTIPNSKKARIIWSCILAVATFICSAWMQLYTAPIWVLFCMAPLTIFLDRKIPENKYKWITK